MLFIVDRVTNLPLLNTLVRQVPDSRTVSVGYVRCAEHDKFPTGKHFNLPGHTKNNMEVSVIEKYRIESSNNRKTREAQFINLFDTKEKLNKKM